VHGVVVAGAQENHVVEIGRAASFPFVDVVGLAPGRVDAAAGGGAVLVADLECSAQAWWCGAVGASDVEHLAAAFGDGVGELVAADRVASRGVCADRVVVAAASGPADVCRLATGRVGGAGDDGGEVGVAEDPCH
jgi:hypothetical protein